jgi:ABC-2 type transport system permease protein
MFAVNDYDGSTICYIDNDNSEASHMVIASLDTDGISVKKTTEAEIDDLMQSYIADYGIIIDKDFEANLLSGKQPKIKEYYVQEKQKDFIYKSIINSQLDNIYMLAKSANGDKASFEKALGSYAEDRLSVQNSENKSKENQNTRLALGFLIQFMMYNAVIATGIILEDKQKGTFYRTLCSPMSFKHYMFENLSAFFLTMLIQVCFILLSIKFLFKQYLGTNIFVLFAVFIVFSLMCVALGLFITSLFKKAFQAYLFIAIFTTPIIMLGGCYWEFSMMSDTMNKIGLFIPTSWVMKSVDSLLAGNWTVGQIATNCSVLMLFTVIFLSLGLARKVDIAK